nr:uncharacterized protein LOC107437854 [Parasteatoda tepidariorum]
MFSSIVCIICAFCLVFDVSAILVGKLRLQEEPASNTVRTSRFLYPRVDEPPCKTDDGMLGRCVDVRICYAARMAISTGNHPIRCGWLNNFIPMVCCHPDQVQHPKLVFRPYRWRDLDD